MLYQQFEKGDKVKLNCLTEQLRVFKIDDLLPGDVVFIIDYDGNWNGMDHYQISDNPNSDWGYLIPINFLEKVEEPTTDND